MSDIDKKLRLLPDDPGIYKFLSKAGRILYIGKAKSVKKRVRSYFMDSHRRDARIVNMLPHIADVEWIVVHTEAEALILEDQLIKTHRPKYNVRLKDDKSYPYFKLSVKERFPRLSLVREIEEDGSLYFGPYVAVGQARLVKKTISRLFPLRQSKFAIDGSQSHRPCLNYHLKRCLAPCAGKVSEADYGRLVGQVHQLLRGNFGELKKSLKREMERLSADMRYEEAAVVRNRIGAITATLQKQRIVSRRKIDRDVLSLVRSGGFANVQALFVRGGLLLGDDSFLFRQADRYEDRELMRSALSRLYVSGSKPLPQEILLPFEYPEASMLEDYFFSRRGEAVKLVVPKRGERRDLIEMARKNGERSLTVHLSSVRSDELVLEEVRSFLRLKNLPRTVECFDISNIAGTDGVAAMVSWKNNRACKKDYRKYRIKSFEGANDYAAMEEVLGRRYGRLIDEAQNLPDLIVIDGGKGQLSSALKTFKRLKLDADRFDVIGLAKGRTEKRAGIKKEQEDYEYVVKPNRKNAIRLKRNSSTLHFLQNVRDEAHRFAVSYHRKTRERKGLHSELEEIPGIGRQKRKLLLKRFGSIEKIGKSSLEELKSIRGISSRNAQDIVAFFPGEFR